MAAIKETKQDKILNTVVHILIFIVFIIILYPLVYIVSASFSDPTLVNSGQMWLFPKGFTLDGYKLLFDNDAIWRGYANTIYYTVLGTSINLIVTIPAAYALSREDLIGRNFVQSMMLVTMFIGGGLVPSYILVKNLGMIDTVWALVIPNAASVWNIVVSRTFFQTSIPKEMEEAATIDGASTWQMFTKIVIPLSAPIIAIMALFYGVGHWNEWFSSLIYLNDGDKYPLQMILRQILVTQEMGSSTSDPQAAIRQAELSAYQADLSAILRYAVIIVASLPMLVVYPFLQRYFVQGVMVGSVKG